MEFVMRPDIQSIGTWFGTLPDRLRQYRKFIVILFCLATALVGAGMGNVVVDESLLNYFKEDDPAKKAYDRFRLAFDGDEYVYIVYEAKDGDIFSQASLAALQGVHQALVTPSEPAPAGRNHPLNHIVEVKSLVNVKYMTATSDVLYSRNFIGTAMPGPREREQLRKKALAHPDYPFLYLSEDSKFGGILIRTDFNAAAPALSRGEGAGPDEMFDLSDTMEADTMAVSSGSEERPGADKNGNSPFIKTDVREYPAFMKALRSILNRDEFTNALTFHPVGNPVLMDFFTTAVIGDMGRLMSILLALIVVMLWVLFRSLSAVVWPVILVLVTVVWTLGIVGWIDMPMSAMLQVIIFLALSVGIADAVHVLSGYLFFRNQGRSHDTALKAVMKKSGLACLLTSITTAVGLLSLAFVPLKPIASFGIFAAMAVMLAFVFTLLLLPLMLDLWAPVLRKESRQKDHMLLGLIRRIEGVGMGRPVTVILVFTVIAAGLGVGVAQLRVDSNFVEIIKEKLPLRHTYDLVDKYMGGTGTMEVMMSFGRADALKDPEVLVAVASLQEFLENYAPHPIVKTVSLVNVVKESWKALNNDDPACYTIPLEPGLLRQVVFLFDNANPKDRKRLASDDYSAGRIGVQCVNAGSNMSERIMADTQDFIDQRFAGLKTRYPDLEVTLTGNMPLLATMLGYIAWAQIKSFGLALGVISLVLFLVLGSFRAGLVALVPNLFPILAAFGLMGFLKVPLDADTLIVAPIIIGLAVDDTIHFLTHLRVEMERERQFSTAVIKTLREAGQAITFTSLILSTGFLVFILSFHNGLSRFGIFAAIAILTALVSDLVLLPALCRVTRIRFGRRIVGRVVQGQS